MSLWEWFWIEIAGFDPIYNLAQGFLAGLWSHLEGILREGDREKLTESRKIHLFCADFHGVE